MGRQAFAEAPLTRLLVPRERQAGECGRVHRLDPFEERDAERLDLVRAAAVEGLIGDDAIRARLDEWWAARSITP